MQKNIFRPVFYIYKCLCNGHLSSHYMCAYCTFSVFPVPRNFHAIAENLHDNGGSEVLGSMRVLPHLDPALRPRRGTVIRVERRAYGVCLEDEGSTCRRSGAPKGSLQKGHSDLRNGRHKSDRNRMGRQPRGRGRPAFPDPVRRKGPQRATTRIRPG